MKTFRLPRKLKKEITKGFQRVYYNRLHKYEDNTWYQFCFYTTPGRKTKSFFKLVNLANKELKKSLKKYAEELK